ncbi:MAG: ROK family protein [Deltaproteobacteria bacterium]|nr:ROK family protein [Deltaproteobacteria bacterium]
MAEHIGIDVGGTFIKAGLVAGDGSIIDSVKLPTDVQGGVEAVEARILEAVEGLESGTLESAALSLSKGPSRTGTIGIGLPGIVDPREGVVRLSPNIPCWNDYPARERLGRLLGTVVRVENDANCAALAEAWLGAGRDLESFLLVTLGTGVGGGVFLSGRLWRGDGGRGGEVGHVVVDPDGLPCGCGARGCLETVSSSTAILREARRAGLKGNVEDLAGRARDGGHDESILFERAGRALGIALAAWLNIIDVHAIIVAGGMQPVLDLLEGPARAEIASRAYGLDVGAVRLLGATFGEDAGIVGAVRLAAGFPSP